MFFPSYRISPRVGSISLISSLARVDLPLPLSPTRARISPRRTLRSASSRALSQDRFLPSQPLSIGKSLDSPEISTNGYAAGDRTAGLLRADIIAAPG